MLSVSIGAWAGPAEGFEMKKDHIGVWFTNDDSSLSPEKVIRIEVTKSGGVKAALDELAAILAGSKDPAFREKLDEAAQGGSDFIANNRFIVKVVYTGEGSLSLSDDDIAALNNLNIPTIDLQDLKPASVFVLTNSNVKNLILPDQWTMDDVEAAAQDCSNLNAALSIGTSVGAGEHEDGTPVTSISYLQNNQLTTIDNPGSLVAYVKKPGTLYQSTIRLGYLLKLPDSQNPGQEIDLGTNTKLGNVDPYTYALSGLKLVTITGTPSARDFNGASKTAAIKFDADGHFVFDKEADETSVDKDAAVGGGSRQLTGTTKTGALFGSNLTKLDLGDAIITDAHYSDLTISWSYSCVSTSLKEIIFPTTSQLTKLPADCLNSDYSLLEELCIPGNIKVLKTRACYISTNIMRHVWTTGGTAHMIYDNGAYLVSDPDNVDHYGHAPLDDATWNAGKTPEGAPRYGTITLPEGLELIESHNFTARSVSDVYVLNVHAPECHVDAFSTIMYMGNNTIDTQYILDQGMVTRQAYAQSVSKGEYITFLHYPRKSTTPDIQRYTDVTREYSVATTLRDGKGNVIYFPNQSELNRAYLQGTTGYLWYAWDSERVPGPAGNENSFANFSGLNALTGHTTAAQQAANGYYLANTMTNPVKTDRSFYDVRLDTDGQPSLAQPAGLDWYYNTKWEEKQLYPEIDATQTQTEIGRVPVTDEEGNPIYVEGDCNYVKDYRYVPAENGEYVQVATLTGYESTQTPVEGVSTYYSDNQGSNAVTPKVQNGYFVEDGKKDVYTAVDKNNDIIGAESQYYTKNGDTYTPSYLMFNNICYYYSEEGEVKGWVQEWGYENPTANHYTSQDLSGTPITSSDSGFGYNTLYWVYYTDVIHYIASNHFIPGKTWYSYDQNSKTYNQITLSWHNPITGDYYYKSGQEPNYSSADGQDYNASTTYYTSNTGETEVNPVNFDNTYYYATYDYTYEVYNGQTTGTRVDKVEYYREGTSEELADDNITKYCQKTDPVYAIEKGTQYDYRGWHQFILTAYATNDDRPFTPVKFYQTDNDWWTVCLPYDLRYSDMIRFFGNETTGEIPYLSKLRYVVRDYDKEKITLVFSKNLMVYKEDIAAMNPGATDDYVHGIIDDETMWPTTENGKALGTQPTDEEGTNGYDPIILHKGVPYLIKPNIDVNAGRSFDVYKNDHEKANPNLYKRLIDAQNVPAEQLETYIYKGEYTVPAYVIGDNAPEATVESRSFQHAPLPNSEGMSGGPKFTYNSSDQIMYGGKKVSARISNKYSYTFVGSFFLSLMPKDCYFLGWDSKKKCAAFWFNKTPNLTSYDWNNQTGIICPNFDTTLQIDPATSLSDPAKWTFAANSVENDNLVGTTSSAKRGLTDMDWGEVDVVVTGIGKVNVENNNKAIEQADVIYDMQGVRMNRPLSRLPKGVYIVNGKKYVVD